MRRMTKALAGGLLLAVALSGCGSQSATTGVARSSATPASITPPPGPPQINWDHVLFNGISTTTSNAKSDGQLAFDPVVPAQLRPISVEVTDPKLVTDAASRGVAYYYDIPGTGRVVLSESPSAGTVADLQAVADAHQGSGEYEMVDVGGSRVLLIAAGGVGRVRAIVNGIAFEITGPAASPDAVKEMFRTALNR